MYAITFDMDTAVLEASYRNTSWRNGYIDIRNCLGEFGFTRQQGSVYYGDETVDAVTAVIAVQELTSRFDWFAASVRDIRMLRIENNDDLMPAIERARRNLPGNR